MLLLTFRSFSLTAQNPSKLYDFISIPSISSDIEANGCFCLLFAVIAWPSRTHPDCMILLAYLQFLTVLGCSGCGAASVSCHVKWVQKSTQHRPKINPKPSQNPSKISIKWHPGAGIDFSSFWGQIWIPFGTHFGSTSVLKHAQKTHQILKQNPSRKLCVFCVVLATFWRSVSIKNPLIFKMFREHPFRTSFSCVFATFLIRHNLKNLCFPAGKHVFP